MNATSRSPVRREVSIADLAVDDDLDGHVGQRLPAERVRPPQARCGDVQRPLDVVAAGSEGVLRLTDHVAVGGRADADRVGGEGVEAGVQAQVGSRVVGVAAQHAEAIDAHCTGVVDTHGAPETPGIPVAIDGLRVLQHSGDVSPP